MTKKKVFAYQSVGFQSQKKQKTNGDTGAGRPPSDAIVLSLIIFLCLNIIGIYNHTSIGARARSRSYMDRRGFEKKAGG